MKLAYADPPYPGESWHYAEGEVDHGELVTRLCDDYPDGWALSTASTTLASVLALCPTGVRVAAWCKPWASFKPGINPAYCWEPVVFRGGRRRTDRAEVTVRDYLMARATVRRGLAGAKPEEFCRWVLNLLGYQDGDELHDLYPGTGIMGHVLDQGVLL